MYPPGREDGVSTPCALTELAEGELPAGARGVGHLIARSRVPAQKNIEITAIRRFVHVRIDSTIAVVTDATSTAAVAAVAVCSLRDRDVRLRLCRRSSPSVSFSPRSFVPFFPVVAAWTLCVGAYEWGASLRDVTRGALVHGREGTSAGGMARAGALGEVGG